MKMIMIAKSSVDVEVIGTVFFLYIYIKDI